MHRLVASIVLAAVAVPAAAGPPRYDAAWKALVVGSDCPAATTVTSKDGGLGGVIRCQLDAGGHRHFFFPPGEFDIDEQVPVPADTTIEGNANPNDPLDRERKLDPETQTFFVATKGVTDEHANYCGNNNNLQQGQAQRLRIGFLLNSNTVIKNINFQGKDKVRPLDNGSLCGGGAFETPGCVSAGFSNGQGWPWVGRHGCRDIYGKANDLVTGDGLGVQNVVIENVRLNDLLGDHLGSQLAVWVAQTRDGSATRNVTVTNLVSMFTQGDGINFHGNVQNSTVENSYLQNTGDDIFAVWGGYYKPAGIVFKNSVGKDAGASRGNHYGVCIAVYGAMEATFSGITCYEPPENKKDCYANLACNSCMMFVHDGWFGAVYLPGNLITLGDYKYLDMQGRPITHRPCIRTSDHSTANVVRETGALLEATSSLATAFRP